MKKYSITLFLLCLMFAGYSQVKLDYSATPKVKASGFTVKGLSAASAYFLHDLQQMEATKDPATQKGLYAKLQERYGIMQGRVPALILLADGRTQEDLAAYDVTVGSAAGGIYTARIPLHRFADLAASGICKTIDVGEKNEPHLDKSRENLGIDQIHAGLHLPHGYDGTGVVVGIIDSGFGYGHPSFYGTDGHFRVKRVWEQKSTTGTPPAGYSYGTEYTTEAELLAAGADYMNENHGTHVAGIAAGSGAPSGDGTAYQGIAPGADLVLVATSFLGSDVCDAISYIYHYAQSVGKPCVINMSFGSTLQCHEGFEPDDLFITSFVNQHHDSLVLVASTGNDGLINVHIQKQFSPEDTLLTTHLQFTADSNFWGGVYLYGESVFSIALTLVNTTTQQQEDFTGFFTVDVDTCFFQTLFTSDGTPLSCEFCFEPDDRLSHPFVGTFGIRIDGPAPSGREVILTVKCNQESEIHGWCQTLLFSASESVEEAVAGDSWYTVSGKGTNTDAVISVGSYATRLHYITYEGIHKSGRSNTIGDISLFSSKGPTMDGRTKPDITAPGEVVVASVNRFAVNESSSPIYDTIEWFGNIEYYSGFMGTSMSSPMVTGIVALWLQQNPSLGVDSVRAILHGTAHNDHYTGNAAVVPSNIWGHGKVNAYGGLPTNTELYLVTACAEVDSMGSVDGGGVVTAGVRTLTAIPGANHTFVAWEDGSTDNPRTVYVICDTLFIATFEVSSDSVAVPAYTEETHYCLIAQGGRQISISNAGGHSLRVYDITGRLIVSALDANGTYRMPSAGVYILQVEGFRPRKVMVN